MASFLLWPPFSAVINVRLALALLVTYPSRTRADAVQHSIILPSVTIRISQCFLLARCHAAFQVCAGKTASDGMPSVVAPSMSLAFSHLQVSEPKTLSSLPESFTLRGTLTPGTSYFVRTRFPRHSVKFVACTLYGYMQLNHSRFLSICIRVHCPSILRVASWWDPRILHLRIPYQT